MHPIIVAIILILGGGYLLYRKFKHDIAKNKAVDEYNDAKSAQEIKEIQKKTEEINAQLSKGLDEETK